MFQETDFKGHEKVVYVNEPQSGLQAIIAVHSTALGPSAGGCRLWEYASPDLALKDALRLSRGMSYKNALANLPMGGGKAVIMGPLPAEKRGNIFKAFGEAVDSLGGMYITAEDVGVKVADMQNVASRTRYASGLSASGGAGGDPSPYTARGVCRGIEAVAHHSLKRSDLDGLTVSVQGVGGVGGHLCKELHDRGAKLIVADIDSAQVAKICDLYGAKAVDVSDILHQDVDVLAPCALGGVITEDVAKSLKVQAVVGGANNQLATPAAGDVLQQRGIAFGPDYLVNAGGIISVTYEYLGTNTSEAVLRDVDAIYHRTREVLDMSDSSSKPSYVVADELAEQKIAHARLAKG